LNLIANWKDVLTKAWSVFAAVSIVICTALQSHAPALVAQYGGSPELTNNIVGWLGLATVVLRVIDQQLAVPSLAPQVVGQPEGI